MLPRPDDAMEALFEPVFHWKRVREPDRHCVAMEVMARPNHTTENATRK
jgi:hypothetical protein